MHTQIPLSALFVTMFNFKTRLTNRLIAAGPVWWCLSQVRCNHNARYSHSLTGRATQDTVEWNLSVSVCSHHALCTVEPLSVYAAFYTLGTVEPLSVCAVTMLSTHRAQWNLSLRSHHAFHTQGTMEPQSAQSPCFPHTGHSPVSHS